MPNTITIRSNKMMSYKGRSLVRSGNTVYYGNPSDGYITRLDVLSSTEKHGIDVSTKVKLTLVECNDKSLTDIKSVMKSSLISSLEVAIVWIDLAIKKKSKT